MLDARSWRHRFVVGLIGITLLLSVLTLGHWVIGYVARPTPPPLEEIREVPLSVSGPVRRLGASYAQSRGSITEVRLVGTPTQIGHAHTRLLYEPMVRTERVTWGLFEYYVPNALARWVLRDLAQWRHRNLEQSWPEPRRAELAAAAAAFDPDPFSHQFPTYQRFLYLSSLYDISLSFEHSPLLGCTSFAFGPDVVEGGVGAVLARNFDFEVHDIFDEEKVVFLVFETGKIPFAAVGWAGYVGVVSGMNGEGLAMVVHGARAGDAQASGEPVSLAVRRTLSTATTAAEAVECLAREQPMVSHIIVLADALGDRRVVERVPNQPDFVRELPMRAAITNHLRGPNASDQKNQTVEQRTSTLARGRRATELAEQIESIDAARALGLLRDRAAAGGAPLALGDRRAIDALIATHAVIFETAARRLWVSEGPHLIGSFVAFDLEQLLDAAYDPVALQSPPDRLAPDPARQQLQQALKASPDG